MRFPTLAIALTGALFLTGCTKLVSLNPSVTDKEATMDPALLGVWHDPDGDDTCIVKQAGNAYTITYVDKSSTHRFEGRLWLAGDAKLLDLVASDSKGDSSNESPLKIPVHATMRVWSEGDTLRLAFLDSDWLREQALQRLPVQIVGDRTVITAPSVVVRTFLVKYGTDPKAHGDPEVLRKGQ